MRRHALLFLVVAAAHAGGTVLAYSVNRVTSDGVSLFPAAGVTVAVLLLVPRRLWTIVLTATFLSELAGNVLIGEVAATGIGSALSNTVEPLVGAAIVLRLVGGAPLLRRRRQLFQFLAGAAVAGPAVGALIGAASTQFTPGHQPFLNVVGRWFTGDALGVLVVGSLILAWLADSPVRISLRAATVERVVAGIAVIGMTAVPFWWASPALAYLALPALAWMALRFGVRGATLGGATVALIADWATIRGHGLFAVLAGAHHDKALWQLQLFLGVLLVTALVLASQVAELAETEKALSASEEKQRIGSLLESSPDPMLILRADSVVEYVNEQFLALSGLRRDELLGQQYVALLAPDRRSAALSMLASVFKKSAGSRTSFEIHGLGASVDRSLDAVLSPLDTADGRVLMATLRDVTERKAKDVALRRALDDAEQATRAKADFLATMSHEIRTPMSAVSSLVDLLGHTDLDDEQRSLLTTMRGSSVNLLRIIDDTLDFSKLEAGMLELESVPYSIADEVRAVASLLEPAATTKGIALIHTTDPAVPLAVLGDPLRVRQILVNLVANAVKFTDVGSVELAAAVSEADSPDAITAVFTIRDTGIGIEPAQQENLFRPFTQAEHSTARHYGGTGLGLSIVSRLVEMMEGSIDLTSAPREGSTFVVKLPATVAPAGTMHTPVTESLVSAASAADPGRLGGHLVLVAEDNDVNRDVLRRQLALLGCPCEVVEDGRAALDRHRSGGVSLLMTDCHMPVMDGFDLTHAIRAGEAEAGDGDDARRLPIVAVTARAMQGEGDRCLAAGMDAFLTKPVSQLELRAVLERLLPAQPVLGPSAVDLTALREIIGDDSEDLAEVLDSFVTSMRALVAELDESLESTDRARVKAAAHRISGTALSVGAARLAALARALELGASGDAATLSSTARWLHAEVAAVTDQISTLGAVGG